MQESVRPVWKIVGGVTSGGVLVRAGSDLSSLKLPERLSTGALVQEVELVPDVLESGGGSLQRLHYRRLTGTGPSEGWITLALNQKMLAVREALSISADLLSHEGREDEFRGVSGVKHISAVLYYVSSCDLISEEMFLLLEDHGNFVVKRISTSKQLHQLSQDAYDWFHTIGKLKLPGEYCPMLPVVAFMPHLYELEEKSLLQNFMNIHRFESCIRGIVFDRGELETARLDRALEDLGLPCVVKPSNEGSRRGIRVAASKEDVRKAVTTFRKAPVWVAQHLECPAFLLNSRKFHIRVFAFLMSRENGTTIYMARRGPLYFSTALFTPCTTNSAAHLSGGCESGFSETWPSYIEQLQSIDFDALGTHATSEVVDLMLSQCREICWDFLSTVCKGAKPRSALAYRLVAFDVLLCACSEELFQAKVMEINISPASEFQQPELRNDLARGILHCLWPDYFPFRTSVFEKLGTVDR